ncbi:PEP-CTERM sorting domain-containing protein [bacterium]|nr:MAG: PEP-CTERM sorting domain-containing protein [bacterium]
MRFTLSTTVGGAKGLPRCAESSDPREITGTYGATSDIFDFDMRHILSIVLASFVLAPAARAGVTLSFNPSDFETAAGGNGLLGPDGVHGVAGGWVTTQADIDGNGGDWYGNFSPGDTVVAEVNIGTQFSDVENVGGVPHFHSVRGIGFQVQSHAFGGFWTEVLVYSIAVVDGQYKYTYSPWLRATGGVSNGNDDGSAQFVGIVSDTPFQGYMVRVRSLTEATFPARFAVGNFRYKDVSFEAVPEPGTMLALGLGAAALMRRKRRS